jgi:hypothetical protein
VSLGEVVFLVHVHTIRYSKRVSTCSKDSGHFRPCELGTVNIDSKVFSVFLYLLCASTCSLFLEIILFLQGFLLDLVYKGYFVI